MDKEEHTNFPQQPRNTIEMGECSYWNLLWISLCFVVHAAAINNIFVDESQGALPLYRDSSVGDSNMQRGQQTEQRW